MTSPTPPGPWAGPEGADGTGTLTVEMPRNIDHWAGSRVDVNGERLERSPRTPTGDSDRGPTATRGIPHRPGTLRCLDHRSHRRAKCRNREPLRRMSAPELRDGWVPGWPTLGETASWPGPVWSETQTLSSRQQ